MKLTGKKRFSKGNSMLTDNVWKEEASLLGGAFSISKNKYCFLIYKKLWSKEKQATSYHYCRDINLKILFKCWRAFTFSALPSTACNPNPCLNGSSCSDTTTPPSCSCLPGQTGSQCQCSCASLIFPDTALSFLKN